MKLVRECDFKSMISNISFLPWICLLIWSQSGLQVSLMGQTFCGTAGVSGESPLFGQDDSNIKGFNHLALLPLPN